MDIKDIFSKVKGAVSGNEGWLKVIIISIAVFIAMRFALKGRTKYQANDMIDDLVTIGVTTGLGSFGSGLLDIVGAFLPASLGIGNLVADTVLPFENKVDLLEEKDLNSACLAAAVVMFLYMAIAKEDGVGRTLLQSRGVY